MLSVLRRGPWSFNDWICVTHKWNPLISDDELKHIPFWVQVSGIPLHLLTKCLVREIGFNLGNFMETNFERENAVMVDFVRMKLWCDIDTPLRFQWLVRFGDETRVLKLRYEKLRNF